MRVEQFAMERMQSTYENQVEFNLSESGVHPLRLGELVEDERGRGALLNEALRYTQSNGTEPLRELVASHYPGATGGHIQITNGGAEANYVTMWNLVEPGDEIVFMVPSYMQTWGLARAFGAAVKEWPLVRPAHGGRWRIDVDALDRLVTARTKVIVICNPNNPTGARFEASDLDRIGAAAAKHGCWVLADEIYRGAERDGRETPSMWGRSDRVVITSGLSKAYGLPGLRIGWVAGPPHLIASLWKECH
jgi:aspartate/methionine/tyrosine aminotransferase